MKKRSKITKVLFIILSSFILLAFLQRQEEQIVWSKDRPLTWADFKGKPLNKSTAGALSFCGIRHYFLYENGLIKINTETSFNCKKSWVNLEDKILSTLEHEQLHFNIAELNSRKLRQELHAVKFKQNGEKAKKQFDITYNKYYIQLNDYQALYDKETTSPRNEIKQKEWLEKIARELSELEAYSNPVIEIKLK